MGALMGMSLAGVPAAIASSIAVASRHNPVCFSTGTSTAASIFGNFFLRAMRPGSGARVCRNSCSWSAPPPFRRLMAASASAISAGLRLSAAGGGGSPRSLSVGAGIRDPSAAMRRARAA